MGEASLASGLDVFDIVRAVDEVMRTEPAQPDRCRWCFRNTGPDISEIVAYGEVLFPFWTPPKPDYTYWIPRPRWPGTGVKMHHKCARLAQSFYERN